MKRINIIFLSFTFLLAGVGFLSALSDTANTHDVTMNIVEIALIDLNDTGLVTLAISAPALGGQDPVGDSDNSKLLQYTIVVSGATTRNVTINWGGADSAPAGTSLLAEATSVPVGCGTAGAQVTVGVGAQSIITGIGSCATGTGGSGAQITYTFSVDTVSSLDVADDQTVTITYTLTDAS